MRDVGARAWTGFRRRRIFASQGQYQLEAIHQAARQAGQPRSRRLHCGPEARFSEGRRRRNRQEVTFEILECAGLQFIRSEPAAILGLQPNEGAQILVQPREVLLQGHFHQPSKPGGTGFLRRRLRVKQSQAHLAVLDLEAGPGEDGARTVFADDDLLGDIAEVPASDAKPLPLGCRPGPSWRRTNRSHLHGFELLL